MVYDEITIDRIKTFHPDLREWLKEIYIEANNKLLPKGYRLRFTDVYRSPKEQDILYSQGRTTKGKIVTNSRGGQSIHNYGLAFDIVILRDKDLNGTFESFDYTIDKYWMRIVNFFKSKGFTWGGDFRSFKDSPHFEYSKGNTYKYFKDLPTFIDNNNIYPKLPSNIK